MEKSSGNNFSRIFSQQPLNQTKKIEFNLKNLPISKCSYHNDLPIMNFCKSPDCLMPLCAECIKIHSMQHRENNSFGDFETLEAIFKETYESLSKFGNFMEEDIKKIHNLQHKNKNAYINLEEKIQVEKNKLIEIIENYFNCLMKEGREEVSKNENRFDEEIDKAFEEIKEKKEFLNKFFSKIQSKKYLKHVIQFFHDDFDKQFNNFHKNISNFIEGIESKFISPIVDYNKLNLISQELPFYIFFPNDNKYVPYNLKPIGKEKIDIQEIPNINFLSSSNHKKTVYYLIFK